MEKKSTISASSLRWKILRRSLIRPPSSNSEDKSEVSIQRISRKATHGFNLIPFHLVKDSVEENVNSSKENVMDSSRDATLCYTLPVSNAPSLILHQRVRDMAHLNDFEVCNRYDIDNTGLILLTLVVVPIICIGVRKFGCYLRELSHETQAASYELRIDVSLEIKDADSLYSALNSFIRVEKLDDPEIRFTCEQCNSQVSIEKQLMLDIAPTIVVFHLKRFQNDGSVVQEGDKHVSFSLELDLLPYTENIQTNNEVVGLFSGGLSATSTLSIIVVVIYGAYLAIRGSMTAGSLTSFILYSGTGQWPSEDVLSHYCLSRASIFREKRIIELGSGYGLAGLIVAMTTEAREVFISDGNPQVVDYIQRNVNANSGSFGGTEVKPLMLHWGQEKDTDISNTFDVIIASDCTFFKEFHEALVQTIKSLLKEEGPSEAILLSPRRGDSLDKFLAEVKDSGLHFSTDEIYDAEVWRRHQRFIEGDDSWPNYEMDHCYPLLVRITR